MSLFLLIVGLVLFVALVLVHEWGHFIAARKNGVEVEEFGVGFPPRLYGRTFKGSDTVYTVNALPLGGFVRLKGEHDADRSKGSFGAASLRAKVLIMVAGVGMNLVTAFILFTLLALVGIPKLIPDQYTVASDTKTVYSEVLTGYVEDGSPAAIAGLQSQDRILTMRPEDNCPNAACTEEIKAAETLSAFTRKYQGQKIVITYQRAGMTSTVTAALRTSEEIAIAKEAGKSIGFLGIVPVTYEIQKNTWSAPIVAAGLIKQYTVLTLKGLGSAIAGLAKGDTAKATEQVSGPVGIFVLLKDGSNLGARFILMVIAIISLTLAIMNTLPIPALDGGRLFVTLAYRFLKRPLTTTIEDRIHGTGFAVLMLLFVLITFVDVRRFF